MARHHSGSADTEAKPKNRPKATRTTASEGPPAPQTDTIRDTFDSIVVAFILAFVFRAFVVEAFVIPTGSMAPGLYGMHGQHRCAACQYPFAYGIREPTIILDELGKVVERRKGTLDGQYNVTCPNCDYVGAGNHNLNNSSNPVVASSGDRILVLKWPYDIGGRWLGPKRWDVVVFKDPQNGDTNFIKRLIGLPGEVLEIIDGDIYAVPMENVPTDIKKALLEPPPKLPGDDRRLDDEQLQRLAALLKIQRKTRVAQDSLWIIHYDHDYKPDPSRGIGFNPPRWVPADSDAGKAWNALAPRITFLPHNDEEHWLELTGKPIADSYGYNNVSTTRAQVPRAVGDVLLEFVLAPRDSAPSPTNNEKGHIVLSLRKDREEFRATIFADGSVLLDRDGKGGVRIPIRDNARIAPLKADQPIRVEFENADYRVALRINGVEIAATTDQQYEPPLEEFRTHSGDPENRNGRVKIEIGARGIPLEIRHLTVHRDVYYRSDEFNRLEDKNLYRGYPGWGTVTNPILLRDDPPDYFCCGDNSPQSKDSRLWWEVCPMLQARAGANEYQLGTVPGDQMIGRAFFVYWPSGLRLSKKTLAIIPNVGRMRIIR